MVVAELQSRFNVPIEVHLDDAEDDGSLYEQWSQEHPGVPVGERRVSTLSADVSAGDAQKITEEVVDIIPRACWSVRERRDIRTVSSWGRYLCRYILEDDYQETVGICLGSVYYRDPSSLRRGPRAFDNDDGDQNDH